MMHRWLGKLERGITQAAVKSIADELAAYLDDPSILNIDMVAAFVLETVCLDLADKLTATDLILPASPMYRNLTAVIAEFPSTRAEFASSDEIDSRLESLSMLVISARNFG